MGKTASLANIGTIADSSLGFRNRLINGGMTVDQRNAGAAVTIATSGTYTLDRWVGWASPTSKYSIEQTITGVAAPAGFAEYLGVTSLSAYSITSGDLFTVNQPIEGFNVADLAWGSASAATVTLSFWVRSSLTGTFGGSVQNSAQNRSYPFTYTISAANTWEQKSVTIAGDTSGTWGTGNGVGIRLHIGLGVGSTFSGTAGSWAASNFLSATGATSVVGTSGATFYITGVQLEKGSTATSFDYRPYGTELALCQRYYQVIEQYSAFTAAQNGTTILDFIGIPTSVSMRATPTASNPTWRTFTGSTVVSNSGGSTTVRAVSSSTPTVINVSVTGFSGLTDNRIASAVPYSANLTLSAEL
jgi:hypothetical protein